MALTTGERLPGIIVTIENVGIIAPAGFERFPAIIGMGDIEVVKESNLTLTRSATSTIDTIPDDAVTVFLVGRSPGANHYQNGIHFIHDPVSAANQIDWSLDPFPLDPPTAVRNEPLPNTRYFVSYTVEMPASAFEPILYIDEDLMMQERGRELIFSTIAPEINQINPVVAGARLAFSNGTIGVVVLQLDYHPSETGNSSIPGVTALDWLGIGGTVLDPDPLDPTGAELEASYEIAVRKIDKVEEFKLWLVPMDPQTDPSFPDDPDTGKTFVVDNNTRFHDHALQASAPDEGRERTVLGSLPRGSDLEDLVSTAQAFKNTGNPYDTSAAGSRIAIPGAKGAPGSNEREACTIAVGSITGRIGENQNINYASAATGGLFSGSRVGAPNNFSSVSGIVLYDSWLLAEARRLRRNGVIPYKRKRADVGSLGTVLTIPISTDTTNVFTEDLSVQDIADFLRQFVRLRLFDLVKNTSITSDTEGTIVVALTSILQTLLNDRVIADFKDVQAQQDTIEPRRIFARARVKPAFPLRWLDVTFLFSTQLN